MRPAVATTLVLGLFAVSPACKKGGADTATPADAKGGAAAEQEGALRYAKAPAKLRQKSHYEFTLSGGGQFGSAKADLVGLLVVEPSGDKLTVTWKVEDVQNLELAGVLEPKAEEGEPPPPDVKAVLLELGKGTIVTDLRGETDPEATKAHPDNKEEEAEVEKLRKQLEEARKAAGSKEAAKKDPKVQALEQKLGKYQIVGMFGGVFSLPTLPKEALELGKEITVESEEEVDLPTGTKLPMEVESTYKLVKIDDASGSRIAEIEISIEASGAVEFEGGMLVVDQSTDNTLLWDLDRNLPVAVDADTSQSFSVGEQGQEISTIIQSEYEPVP